MPQKFWFLILSHQYLSSFPSSTWFFLHIFLSGLKNTHPLELCIETLENDLLRTRNGEEDRYLVGFRGGLQRDKKASEDTERPLISDQLDTLTSVWDTSSKLCWFWKWAMIIKARQLSPGSEVTDLDQKHVFQKWYTISWHWSPKLRYCECVAIRLNLHSLFSGRKDNSVWSILIMRMFFHYSAQTDKFQVTHSHLQWGYWKQPVWNEALHWLLLYFLGRNSSQ